MRARRDGKRRGGGESERQLKRRRGKQEVAEEEEKNPTHLHLLVHRLSAAVMAENKIKNPIIISVSIKRRRRRGNKKMK